VRDFGLMMATFAVFLKGPDSWSLDNFLKSKSVKRNTYYDPERKTL